jgi:cobalt-zinc-cadmium efflux system membrane fusion protein
MAASQESTGNQESSSKPVTLSTLQKAAIKLEVATVRTQSLKCTLSSPGKIEAIPTMQFALHAPLAGTITKIAIGPGQLVHVGQVLAVLQSPDLNRLSAETLQGKTQVSSEISQAQVLLDDEISESKSKLDFAQANYERDKALFERGLASQEEVQLALSDLGVAQARSKAAVRKREVTLKALQEKYSVTLEPLNKRLELLGVSDTDIKAMMSSKNAIGSVPIRSTCEGLVTEIKASVGQSIDPSVLLFTVTDINKVWATAFAYEEDVSRLRQGEKVRVKVPSLPNEVFEGVLTFIGTQVDSQTRTLPVRAEISNPLGVLKPDMFATLDTEIDKSAHGIIVPREAVITHDGESLVFLEERAGYVPATVKVGRAFGNQLEITTGLSAGDKIVVHGAFSLLAEWLKEQQGEKAFSQPSGDGEAESGDVKKEASGPTGLSQSVVFGIAIAAFFAGVIVTAFVLRSTKGKGG